jgi:hypothetical protein
LKVGLAVTFAQTASPPSVCPMAQCVRSWQKDDRRHSRTVGRLIPKAVLGPPERRRKLVIVGDAETTEGLAEPVRGADALVEGTFLDREAAIARNYGHLTAGEAAALAAMCDVKQLVLTHISGRYIDEELLAEAKKDVSAQPGCHGFSIISRSNRPARSTCMAKKLKIHETSLGFFDLAIAAPSMKAALEAWGADSNLFHQGAAKQSEDPDVIAATMAAPGVVLKRPVGSNGPFKEQVELPTDLAGDRGSTRSDRKSQGRKAQKPSRRGNDEAADRKAALAFEKEQNRRARERAKEEAALEKERERRQHAIDKAPGALDAARRKHEEKAVGIRAELKALEEESRAEEARWEKEMARLQAALRRPRG